MVNPILDGSYVACPESLCLRSFWRGYNNLPDKPLSPVPTILPPGAYL
jgi:hypothetical protein